MRLWRGKRGGWIGGIGGVRRCGSSVVVVLLAWGFGVVGWGVAHDAVCFLQELVGGFGGFLAVNGFAMLG